MIKMNSKGNRKQALCVEETTPVLTPDSSLFSPCSAFYYYFLLLSLLLFIILSPDLTCSGFICLLTLLLPVEMKKNPHASLCSTILYFTFFCLGHFSSQVSNVKKKKKVLVWTQTEQVSPPHCRAEQHFGDLWW